MIITNIQELRLAFPSHALNSVSPLLGFIENSESDVLIDKLGKPLFDKLVEHYDNGANVEQLIQKIKLGNVTDPMDKLLIMSQRVVLFDAFGRAIGVQAVSVNAAGINVSTADDYALPTKEIVDKYVQTCLQESHRSVNRLLQTLEEWCKDESLTEITDLWKKSRFFYLAAELIIPSAMVLQEYINFYENREKFIMLLPDLRFIQEETICDVIGEELCDYFVKKALEGDEDALTLRIIHKMRKAVAKSLEARTDVLKTDKAHKERSHNEAVHLIEVMKEYICNHQQSLPEGAHEALKKSPLYNAPDQPKEEYSPKFKNNSEDAKMFVTPCMN